MAITGVVVLKKRRHLDPKSPPTLVKSVLSASGLSVMTIAFLRSLRLAILLRTMAISGPVPIVLAMVVVKLLWLIVRVLLVGIRRLLVPLTTREFKWCTLLPSRLIVPLTPFVCREPS